MSQNPKIPGQRGPQGVTRKPTKRPAAFQPEYVNGSLELSGPNNSRPGKLSQYTEDLLVYVSALEKETIGLRDQQSTLDAKIAELNGTITELEQRIVANNEQYLRNMATAKSATRTANAAMDAERTRANFAEAIEAVRQQMHGLFGGAPLGSLSSTKGSLNGGLVRVAHFTCGGLHFTHRLSSAQTSVTVESAANNPIKLRPHVITRFAGHNLILDDKTYLLFLREAATAEGYELNLQGRIDGKEMEQLYDMPQMTAKFGCGHTGLEHLKLREQLLKRFAPAVVTAVFKRLEGHNSTNDHQIELTRAIMIGAGMSEDTANAMAKAQSQGLDKLNQAKQLLRNESIDPELVTALGETALSGTIDFEALDLRPENLRLKPTSASEALRRLHKYNGQYPFGATHGRHDLISPVIGEYNRESTGYATFSWDRFSEFPMGETHDLGTDSLYDVPGGQPCVDGRPTKAAKPKPGHSGECRNNGFSDNCTHPDHRSKG